MGALYREPLALIPVIVLANFFPNPDWETTPP